MKIELVKSLSNSARAGQIVDLPDAMAKKVVEAGIAKAVGSKKAAPKRSAKKSK